MTEQQYFDVLPVDDDGKRFRLVGELDLATSDRLHEVLAQANGDDGAGAVTLDLAELTYIDSMGLHVIAEYLRTGEAHSLRLLNVLPMVRRVFEITALDTDPRLEIVGDGDVG